MITSHFPFRSDCVSKLWSDVHVCSCACIIAPLRDTAYVSLFLSPTTTQHAVLDSATLGASLHRTTFFEQGTSKTTIQSQLNSDEFNNVQQFLLKQNDNTKSEGSVRDNGISKSTTSTTLKRLGELNTDFLGSDADECAIGKAILPQVV